MLNTVLHNAQLIIVFAFVLLSLLGGIFRKVQEQREIQRRKSAADRARLEMLRTGRGANAPVPMLGTGPVFQQGPASTGGSMGAPTGPPTSAAEALARLEEIARRRQEQMGKVRGAGQQQRRSNEPAGPVIIMGPSGPIVLRPGQQMPPSPSTAATTGRKGKGRQQPQQPQRQAKPAKEPAREIARPEAPAQPSFNVEHVRGAAASNGPSQAPVSGRAVLPNGTPRTPQEWRQLVAANAIFGRPVGEQGFGDEGPGRVL